MKFYSLFFFVMASVSLLTATGCTKPEDETELSITVPVKSHSSGSGEQMIRVTATGDWTLRLQFSDGGGWAEVDPATGRDSKSGIRFHWDENPAEEERSCTLILQKDKRTAEAVFVQSAYVPVPDPVDPNKIQADPVPRWMELPATDSKDLYFLTQDMFLGATRVRNFSYYYDTEAKLSHWVAYPLNSSLRGKGKRSDAWGLDPKVPEALQPVIFSNYGSDADGVTYTRGHQIPSADRYLTGSNEKTFYFTNMTPQLNSLNSHLWALLEENVRSWSNVCDTLYVVTGADIKGSTRTVPDNTGKRITVPVGYYKALVAYSKSSPEAYRGIAFYMEHKSYESTTAEMMKCALSIRDLEKKIGTDFFVNLPSEYAEKVETTVDGWWQNEAN